MAFCRQPYISELKSTLDGFLDLINYVEGMETPSCLFRAFVSEQEDPIVRLYRGDDLIGSTLPSDVGYNWDRVIGDIAYRFLEGSRKHAAPLSVHEMDIMETWGGLNAAIQGVIEDSVRNLERAGILRITGQAEHGWNRYEFVTEDGFSIEYQKPKNPTPVKSMSDLKRSEIYIKLEKLCQES